MVSETIMAPKVIKMFVVKRNGRREPVMFDKITSRIEKLCYGLDQDYIDSRVITKKVINGVYSGVTTVELDNIAAEIAIMLSSEHPDYGVLAARLAVSNLHKETLKCFSEVCQRLRFYKSIDTGKDRPLISEAFYQIVMRNAARLNSAIIYDRDYSFSYFGFKILEQSVLNKMYGKVVERPQQMLMRVAIAMHGEDIESVINAYNLMSRKFYIPDGAALIGAGFPYGQMARAFSLNMKSDSIEGIIDSLEECSLVTHAGGEVGLSVNCIRATGSYIAGTNGTSNGLVPMLRVYNDMVNYVHQTKNPECAKMRIYIEPWHADILDILNLKLPTGKLEQRARELCYALWIPDLFMKRVEEDADWSLMCPDGCRGLYELYGEKFEELYTTYEKDGKFKTKIKARNLWLAVLKSQIETGGPSILFKDTCNRKSSHKNLGVLTGSNYTADCMTYSSPKEIPTVVTTSISLIRFVNSDKQFDFENLKEIVKTVTQDLNALVNNNNYITSDMKTSTKKIRPIAIGIQGLADTFIRLRLPFESEEAQALNKKIFETIYFSSLEASCDLAEKFGPYEGYQDSPISKGILQYDMWGCNPSESLDWHKLKERIAQHGVRNSLLVSLMPTTFQSEALGSTESFQPLNSNITYRKLQSGTYQEVNKYLLSTLSKLGLWNKDMESDIIKNNGSIQHLEAIPEDVKNLFKTKWEVSQKIIVKMAADRGPFIDHSQALNIYMAEPNFGKLNTMNFDTWKSGLKTGLHCLYTSNIPEN